MRKKKLTSQDQGVSEQHSDAKSGLGTGHSRVLLPRLFSLAGSNAVYIPVVVALGLLVAVFEGLGLYLIVPLFGVLVGRVSESWADNPILAQVYSVLEFVPEDQRVQLLVFLVAFLIILKNGLEYCDAITWNWLEARINRSVQAKMYHKLLFMKLERLDAKNNGEIVNTIETQSWSVVDTLSALIYVLVDICAAVFFLVLLFLLSWQMTIAVLVGTAIIAVSVQVLTRSVEKIGSEIVSAERLLSIRLWDSLLGLKTIRTFSRENYERERYDAAVHRVLQAGLRQSIISEISGPMVQILALVLIGGVSVAALLSDPAMLPAVISFVLILQRLLPRIQSMISLRVDYLGDRPSIKNVLAWLDEPLSEELSATQKIPQDQPLEVAFDGIDFAYQSARTDMVLRGVSAAVPGGKITCIVGPSGAGKSTLISILSGQHEASGGKVRVCGVSLENISTRSWRQSLAVVNQDAYLFNGTITENIAYGRPDATDEEVAQAAERANAHDFIQALPLAYQTQLSDNGSELSSGQRQRISLARAFVRKPRMLILDEATNALDPLSETVVQRAIEERDAGCTVVLVAHRASTAMQANHIVVLSEGRVVQQGSPRDLLSRPGLFKDMFEPHLNLASLDQ